MNSSGKHLNSMENYSDLDTSSESEYNSGEGSTAVSECDEDEPSQDLEPEPSEYYDKYMNTPWNPDAQIQAQLDAAQLAQLHAEIKARAEIPHDPTYPKFSGPGLSGNLTYAFYRTMYSTRSTISSFFGA
jgi:hypothetical protein